MREKEKEREEKEGKRKNDEKERERGDVSANYCRQPRKILMTDPSVVSQSTFPE